MSQATDSLDIAMTVTFPDGTDKTVNATISGELLNIQAGGAADYVANIGDRMVHVLGAAVIKYVNQGATK